MPLPPSLQADNTELLLTASGSPSGLLWASGSRISAWLPCSTAVAPMGLQRCGTGTHILAGPQESWLCKGRLAASRAQAGLVRYSFLSPCGGHLVPRVSGLPDPPSICIKSPPPLTSRLPGSWRGCILQGKSPSLPPLSRRVRWFIAGRGPRLLHTPGGGCYMLSPEDVAAGELSLHRVGLGGVAGEKGDTEAREEQAG